MMPALMMLGAAAALVVFTTLVVYMVQFKRCPSDRILVVYGKIGGGATVTSRGFSAKCYHGGGAFIMPITQDYQYLDLTPIPIEIKLEGALSQQNIRAWPSWKKGS